MKKLAMLALACSTATAHAQWIEASGQATIQAGDVTTARAQATEDAVRRALLFAGVSVRSVQEVTDGLLTREQLQVRSYGDMQQVQIVSERKDDGLFEVTIRADIVPSEPVCPNVGYRKKLLVAPFTLVTPEQAVIGNLFELGRVSSKVFQEKLTEISHSSWPESFNNPVVAKQLSYQERKAILQQHGARYLLTADLEDISLGDQTGVNWEFWSDPDRKRYFHLQVTLHDLAEDRQVFSQKYQTSAEWTYRKTTAFNPHDFRFWETPYGKSASRILNAAALDVEEALRCEAIEAEIIQVKENQVLLNIGQLHGVAVGDKFQLVHRRELRDSFGQTQPLLAPTSLHIEVTQVNSTVAWAQSIDQQLLANIQIGDIATVIAKPVDEFGEAIEPD